MVPVGDVKATTSYEDAFDACIGAWATSLVTASAASLVRLGARLGHLRRVDAYGAACDDGAADGAGVSGGEL